MNEIKEAIRSKILELARELGRKARNIQDDEEIPATGLLDSAALMELVMWFENTYDLSVDQAEITMENFGTINAIASYWQRHAGKPHGA
jgi:D-alanine--poly(phosphoribitol) ligase subunit 2